MPHCDGCSARGPDTLRVFSKFDLTRHIMPIREMYDSRDSCCDPANQRPNPKKGAPVTTEQCHDIRYHPTQLRQAAAYDGLRTWALRTCVSHPYTGKTCQRYTHTNTVYLGDTSTLHFESLCTPVAG